MQTDLFRTSDDLAQVRDLVRRGALFAVNHSGGKDSQAMLVRVLQLVPRDQVVLVHADLGEVEWAGAQAHIAATAPGLELIVAEPATSFFQMVDRRGMFPSPSVRQCTSDLKRGPIERELRRYLKANPRFGGLVVNCMGMRAAESDSRAKLEHAAPAADLYRSDWFSKARAYAEAQGGGWAILSALHGVVAPDQVLEPYDFTIDQLDKQGRGAWSDLCTDQLNHLAPDRELELLAGENYRTALHSFYRFRFCFPTVRVPMQGLGIGHQKQWLARQLQPAFAL